MKKIVVLMLTLKAKEDIIKSKWRSTIIVGVLDVNNQKYQSELASRQVQK